jgi:hypothetical protein
MPVIPGPRPQSGGRSFGRATRPVLRRLRRAYGLLAAGEPEAAGRILEQLARGAQARNFPRAAPLLLEAGRAHLMAGGSAQAIDLIQDALSQLSEARGGRRLAAAARRALQALEAHGMGEEAERLRRALVEKHPSVDFSSSAAEDGRPVRELPASCPHCGGPVRPDELERGEGAAAFCAYCGLSLG